jgi:hypothetical protein
VTYVAQPDEQSDALEVYLGRSGRGSLSRVLSPVPGPGVGTAVQRVTSAALRGGLTSWVRAGMSVRRLRGRADPLAGLDQRGTFEALARLVEAAVEGSTFDGPQAGERTAHVRTATTSMPSRAALDRIEQVIRPYAAAASVTRTGRAVIGWFAIRHLIETRSSAYSLQIVHLTPDGPGPCQLSLMLPRVGDPEPGPAAGQPTPPADAVPAGQPLRARSGGVRSVLGPRRLRRAREQVAAPGGSAPLTASGGRSSAAVGLPAGQLQDYLDAYLECLTRELLLEPLVASEPARFAWTPEPTGDGGVAVGGTVPAAVGDRVVLRMAAQAVARCGERSPDSAGMSLGEPEPDGDLLVRRWAIGPGSRCVLSVAARSGGRRRPTQVLIHFAGTALPAATSLPGMPSGQPSQLAAPHEIPRTGAEVESANGLLILPLWWHDADARCDGNDVILYEMPFRGRRLRVRANDYPAEPMYTLLVGEPGAEVAAVDLERWPSSWIRPRGS